MPDENAEGQEPEAPETGADAPDVADTSPDSPDVPETTEDAPAPDDVAETGGDPPAPADVPETSPEEAAVAAAPGAPADVEEDPPVDKARAARKPRTDAQKEKRKADDARRKAAIEATPRPKPTEAQEADAKRKAGIQDELIEAEAEITEAEDHIASCKERCKELLNELYPQLGASDRHVDAVRGYIASEKKIRANRALQPARLKALLEAAGKSPIDAAFSVQRARGMARPTRKAPVAASTGEGDAGKKDATAAE